MELEPRRNALTQERVKMSDKHAAPLVERSLQQLQPCRVGPVIHWLPKDACDLKIARDIHLYEAHCASVIEGFVTKHHAACEDFSNIQQALCRTGAAY